MAIKYTVGLQNETFLANSPFIVQLKKRQILGKKG